ncbi:MAG: 1-deoxy-D-xylulose-5-phosphate synthase [Treponema sp.]|nr:1-deoxy-D-xylulose-5-phosphate synthase [Treponema sp.]
MPLSLQELRTLDLAGLNRLAGEIRELIVSVVSRNGGHLASNLGVVELTIALHLVFDSPREKIIWDVGHQCYAHKILTGRYGAFPSLRKAGGIAGFPKVSESPHDAFNTGHASTSISAALGMLAAEKLLGTGNQAAAVIGDGALTGGLAYEALSHAGQLGLPLVVILNDNKMSIGPNVGAMSKYLSRLSMKKRYQQFRRAFDAAVQKIPFFGNALFKIIVRLKRAVKAVFYTDNFFVDLGFEYVGPIDGHQITPLARVISDAKKLKKPVVVHVITRKGKGHGSAEDNPRAYHNVAGNGAAGHDMTAFTSRDSTRRNSTPHIFSPRTFTRVFSGALLEAGGKDDRVAAITAAMDEGTGLLPFKTAFPARFYDVGIAEGHAVAFAAGLAAGGLRPVVAIYSTFIQRAADAIIHDVCLQNLPVVFALDRAGLVSADGETHQGLFDISLFRSSPNMTILAPAGEEEFTQMVFWALASSGPVIIRYPKALCPAGDPAFSLPLEKGRGVWISRSSVEQGDGRRVHETERGRGVCIMFAGGLYPQVISAGRILESRDIEADLYNLRFLKPIDEDYLSDILNQYDNVILAEEGSRSGGFGEYLAELVIRRNCSCLLKNLGCEEKFDALGEREELLARNGLDAEGIADAVASEVNLRNFTTEFCCPKGQLGVEHGVSRRKNE